MFFYPNYIYMCFSSNKTSIQRLKTRLPSLRGLSVEALGDHGPSQSLLGHQGGADAFELLQPHLPAGRNREKKLLRIQAIAMRRDQHGNFPWQTVGIQRVSIKTMAFGDQLWMKFPALSGPNASITFRSKH